MAPGDASSGRGCGQGSGTHGGRVPGKTSGPGGKKDGCLDRTATGLPGASACGACSGQTDTRTRTTADRPAECGHTAIQAAPVAHPVAVPTKDVQARAAFAASAMPPLRVVFMGTPEFAAVILRSLCDSPGVEVAAVYTQPDRPAGRGKKLTPPAVKQLAASLGLPVLQPPRFSKDAAGEAALAELAAYRPDVLIVAAYGLILPQAVLDIPRLMPINVHASLLPKYRGAAPIQRAIMQGEAVTGVTIMRMEAGLDTGPILMQRAVGIGCEDTSADLHNELAREGADLLLASLERLRAGALPSIAQDDARATHAAKLSKEESLLDFTLSPRRLHDHIRGLTPWPGGLMYLLRPGKDPLPVQAGPGRYPLSPAQETFCAQSLARCRDMGQPAQGGAILGLVDGALLAACGEACYAFTQLRPAGKKSMDAAAFHNGYLTGTDAAQLSALPSGQYFAQYSGRFAGRLPDDPGPVRG